MGDSARNITLKLIAEGQLSIAANAMLDWALQSDSEFVSECVLIASRISYLRRLTITGERSLEELVRFRMRITSNMVQLLVEFNFFGEDLIDHD